MREEVQELSYPFEIKRIPILDNRHLRWSYCPTSREIDYREKDKGHSGSGAPVTGHLEYFGSIEELWIRDNTWLVYGNGCYSLWDTDNIILDLLKEMRNCDICKANNEWIQNLTNLKNSSG